MPSGKYTRKSLKERLLDKVLKSVDGCWEWDAQVNRSGYGFIWRDGKKVKAHRVSYEIHKGKIPEGMVIMHICDNPKCINPEHLNLGTQAENVQDCINKGRARKRCPTGEDNPNSRKNRERRGLYI